MFGDRRGWAHLTAVLLTVTSLGALAVLLGHIAPSN